MVRVAVIDLERRMAVVRAEDNGAAGFPHALRGALAAMLAEPLWHVVVALGDDHVPRPEVAAVLKQAADWARDGGCRLSVASLRDVGHITTRLAEEAAEASEA